MTKIKASKKISEIKRGDIVKVDGKGYEVDQHYLLIDHGSSKEMAIELFDPKTDKDFQIRYFDNRVEDSIQFFELKEIVYNEVEAQSFEW